MGFLLQDSVGSIFGPDPFSFSNVVPDHVIFFPFCGSFSSSFFFFWASGDFSLFRSPCFPCFSLFLPRACDQSIRPSPDFPPRLLPPLSIDPAGNGFFFLELPTYARQDPFFPVFFGRFSAKGTFLRFQSVRRILPSPPCVFCLLFLGGDDALNQIFRRPFLARYLVLPEDEVFPLPDAEPRLRPFF